MTSRRRDKIDELVDWQLAKGGHRVNCQPPPIRPSMLRRRLEAITAHLRNVLQGRCR